MASASLTVYQEFNSWEDFYSAVKRYCDATFQPMVKIGSKKCAALNSTLKDGWKSYPEEMEYVYCTYECTHRGSYKPRGNGGKKYSSFKSKCPAQIRGCLSKDRKKIIVKRIFETHNHEIGREVYKHYPMNRLLSGQEEEKVEELSRLNLSTRGITKKMREITGKPLLRHDIMNLRNRIRKKEKTCSAVIQNWDDAEMLQILAERMRSEEKNKYKLAKDSCDKLYHMLLQLGTDKFNYYIGMMDTFQEMVGKGERFLILPETRVVGEKMLVAVKKSVSNQPKQIVNVVKCLPFIEKKSNNSSSSVIVNPEENIRVSDHLQLNVNVGRTFNLKTEINETKEPLENIMTDVLEEVVEGTNILEKVMVVTSESGAFNLKPEIDETEVPVQNIPVMADVLEEVVEGTNILKKVMVATSEGGAFNLKPEIDETEVPVQNIVTNILDQAEGVTNIIEEVVGGKVESMAVGSRAREIHKIGSKLICKKCIIKRCNYRSPAVQHVRLYKLRGNVVELVPVENTATLCINDDHIYSLKSVS